MRNLNRSNGIASNSRSSAASLLSGSRGSTSAASNRSRPVSMGGGSQQLMIHRPQQHTQDHKSKQMEQQSEGMISMDEGETCWVVFMMDQCLT